jgi:hypothetical protein
VAENTYQVVKSESLTELYDKLYQVAQGTTRGIAFSIPTHNEGGALNLSTIKKRGEQGDYLKRYSNVY